MMGIHAKHWNVKTSFRPLIGLRFPLRAICWWQHEKISEKNSLGKFIFRGCTFCKIDHRWDQMRRSAGWNIDDGDPRETLNHQNQLSTAYLTSIPIEINVLVTARQNLREKYFREVDFSWVRISEILLVIMKHLMVLKRLSGIPE